MKYAHILVTILIIATGIGVATGNLVLSTFSTAAILFLLAYANILLYSETHKNKSQ